MAIDPMGIQQYTSSGNAAQASKYGATIDENYVKQFIKATPSGMYNVTPAFQFLTGETQGNAQGQAAVGEMIGKMNDVAKQVFAQKTAQLKAINPAFDPANYMLQNISQAYNAGEGTSANVDAPVARAQIQLDEMFKAMDRATKAAQTYQQTGQIQPYPTRDEMVNQSFFAQHGWGGTDMAFVKKAVSGNLGAEQMATANAAAARVGQPLPYPQAKIGAIQGGGAITDQNVGQAYQNGTLTTQGTNIVNSVPGSNTPTAGFAAGGTGATTSSTGTAATSGASSAAANPQIQAIQQQIASGKNAAGQPLSSGQLASLQSQLASLGGGTTQTTTPGATGATNASGAATTGTTGQTGTNATAQDPAAMAAAMATLNKYLNDGTIDSGTYQFFKKAVETWNPGQEVDYANILNTFEQIKNSDINPHFQEQSRQFIDSLQTNFQTLKQQRDLELQQETAGTKANITGTQQDLANRGMLFTGEAVKQLGTDSPFAQTGSAQAQASAIPTVDFAGLPMGTTQLANQAATSTSALRYQNSLKDLSRQAESTLGTTGSANLIPGVEQLGGITGTQVEQQKSAQASALTNLYKQDSINQKASQPQNIFSS